MAEILATIFFGGIAIGIALMAISIGIMGIVAAIECIKELRR